MASYIILSFTPQPGDLSPFERLLVKKLSFGHEPRDKIIRQETERRAICSWPKNHLSISLFVSRKAGLMSPSLSDAMMAETNNNNKYI
jgi:hypothetical protein